MRRVLLLVAVLFAAAAAAIVAFQVMRDRDYRTLLSRGDTALRSEQYVAAIEAFVAAV